VAQRSGGKRVPVNFLVIAAIVFVTAMLISPGRVTTVIANIVPAIYEGTPCANLRAADNRAFHQSIVGRAVLSPIELQVRASALPTAADGFLSIYITVINNSLGTVPFVFDPNQVIIGDNGSSGIGLIFNTNSLGSGGRQDPASFADNQLRLLVPRQRCVHEVRIPAGNVLVDPVLTGGQGQVRAFYRNNARGTTVLQPGTIATPIFRDQGLWVGFVESPNVTIPLAPPPAA